MIHFQIQPELIGNITKVILAYNGAIVQEVNIEGFTKEKLLRKKEWLLTIFLRKKVREVLKGINEHESRYHAQTKKALLPTLTYRDYLEWWYTRKGIRNSLKDCLPVGRSSSARSVRESYTQMLEIIKYYEQEILPDALAESGH